MTTRTTPSPRALRPKTPPVRAPTDFDIYRLVHEPPSGRRVTRRQAARYLSDVSERGGTRGGHARWQTNVAHVPNPVWHWRWRPPEHKFGTRPSERVADPLTEFADARRNARPEKETRLLVDAFAKYGKNFRKVANCLPGSTPRDIALFYYQNKRKLSLKRVAARGQKAKRGRTNWLALAAGRRGKESATKPAQCAAVR